MEPNPILDSMFQGDAWTDEKDERTPDPHYGAGRWSKAILRSVEPQAANDFGHSIMLKADLKGEEGNKAADAAILKALGEVLDPKTVTGQRKSGTLIKSFVGPIPDKIKAR